MRLVTGPSRRGLGRGIAVTLVMLAVCGCTPWPEFGGGGMAERHPTRSVAIMELEARCDALSRAGADRLAAAGMYEARLVLRRARREVAGDLLDDAAKSIWRAEALVIAMERDMGVSRRGGERRSGSGT